MHTKEAPSEATMSFSLGTMACGVIPKAEGLAHGSVRQARMLPQSTGGAVLGLRSRRALSPGPREELERTRWACHPKRN
jgi:hypothetical protein